MSEESKRSGASYPGRMLPLILYSEGTLEEAFYQIAPCAEEEYHNQT